METWCMPMAFIGSGFWTWEIKLEQEGVLMTSWLRSPLCNLTALGCFVPFSDWFCVLCRTNLLRRDQAELLDLNGRWKMPARLAPLSVCSLTLYPESKYSSCAAQVRCPATILMKHQWKWGVLRPSRTCRRTAYEEYAWLTNKTHRGIGLTAVAAHADTAVVGYAVPSYHHITPLMM